MSFPIIPVGTKLLIEPIEKPEEVSGGGIALVNSTLSEGKVVAVSSGLSGLYNIGDTVLYPTKKGIEEPFQGTVYRWLDAAPQKEEIYGIRTK